VFLYLHIISFVSCGQHCVCNCVHACVCMCICVSYAEWGFVPMVMIMLYLFLCFCLLFCAGWLCYVQPHTSVSAMLALHAPSTFLSHFVFHDLYVLHTCLLWFIVIPYIIHSYCIVIFMLFHLVPLLIEYWYPVIFESVWHIIRTLVPSSVSLFSVILLFYVKGLACVLVSLCTLEGL
jgi:hypothetical protein